MNKTIGIILAIIVIAGAIFFFTKGNDSETQTAGDTATTENASEESMENTSIKKLLGMKDSQKCTFETTEGGETSTGTFYFADGKGRGEFSSVIAGQTSKGNMIIDGTTTWFWQADQNTGMKMAFDPETAVENSQNKQALDPNKDYKYDCDSWNGDKSIFTPPSNVTFSELAIPSIPAMPSGAANSPTGSAMTPEAICNSLPEQAKAQCLAAIKKN